MPRQGVICSFCARPFATTSCAVVLAPGAERKCRFDFSSQSAPVEGGKDRRVPETKRPREEAAQPQRLFPPIHHHPHQDQPREKNRQAAVLGRSWSCLQTGADSAALWWIGDRGGTPVLCVVGLQWGLADISDILVGQQWSRAKTTLGFRRLQRRLCGRLRVRLKATSWVA